MTAAFLSIDQWVLIQPTGFLFCGSFHPAQPIRRGAIAPSSGPFIDPVIRIRPAAHAMRNGVVGFWSSHLAIREWTCPNYTRALRPQLIERLPDASSSQGLLDGEGR